MKFNRRSFLQGAGFGIASLSGFFGDAIIPKNKLSLYAATLAKSTPRKLALLVGINQYSQKNNLRGCLTDVELQKELLISRFGFNNQDIVTLTNNNGSRDKILTTFDEHISKQVQENDIVVFHFSGYGRQVKLDDDSITESLITANSSLEDVNNNQDILLDTLINLFQSLKTNRCTLVLDTSYQSFHVETDTKLWLRTYASKVIPTISNQELAFNKQIKEKNNTASLLLKNKAKIGANIFTAATEGFATEITSNSFNAGLFTYSLTQSLWESYSPINSLILSKKIAANIALINGELQYTNIALAIKNDLNPYHLPANADGRGDIVITKINESNNVEFDLVGLPLLILFSYGINSCFRTEVNPNQEVVIQLNSLVGNKGKGFIVKGKEFVDKGMVLGESIRVIPREVFLMVGLDSTLQRIEKVDATSALTGVDDIRVINLGDNYVDCILGKLTSNGSYGLFSQAGMLLPNTMSKTPNEAVSTAVKRLGDSLRGKLAQKLFHLVLNANSSGLPVRVSVEYSQDKQDYVSYQQTFSSVQNSVYHSNSNVNVAQQKQLINISAGSFFTITIDNDNDYDLYYLLLNINSSGRAIAYFSSKNVMVNGKQNFTIPNKDGTLKLMDNGSHGIGELIVICSKTPFNNTFNKLYKTSDNNLQEESIIILDKPSTIAKSIFLDLHEGGKVSSDLVSNLTDVYALESNNWAGFNFVYEIA